jgi:Domain of unknown function (DUF5076)
MDRVTQNDDADPRIVYRPIIIVEAIEGDEQQYLLHLTELDPMLNEPKLFGILLSDLLDHIAIAYHQSIGRDQRDIRRDILKTLRDEDRFKEKDPMRAPQRGITIMPPKN